MSRKSFFCVGSGAGQNSVLWTIKINCSQCVRCMDAYLDKRKTTTKKIDHIYWTLSIVVRWEKRSTGFWIQLGLHLIWWIKDFSSTSFPHFAKDCKFPPMMFNFPFKKKEDELITYWAVVPKNGWKFLNSIFNISKAWPLRQTTKVKHLPRDVLLNGTRC